MPDYKNVLVAIDFSPSSDRVIQRAFDIVKNNNTIINIAHIVDHLPPMGFGEEPLIAPDWMIPEKALLDQAKKSLENFAVKHSLADIEQIVSVGTPHHEIVRLADEKSCDLIVLGSHGRHGVRLLLGSTANGVLHHANCDVLAVHVEDE